jgi:hypothetical protein
MAFDRYVQVRAAVRARIGRDLSAEEKTWVQRQLVLEAQRRRQEPLAAAAARARVASATAEAATGAASSGTAPSTP